MEVKLTTQVFYFNNIYRNFKNMLLLLDRNEIYVDFKIKNSETILYKLTQTQKGRSNIFATTFPTEEHGLRALQYSMLRITCDLREG
jgi:hypothetical protein